MVDSFCLRAGNASCANNVISFVDDLVAKLTSHIRLQGVRGDSGFCVPELLEVFEIRRPTLPMWCLGVFRRKSQTFCAPK
jgi:hypothetical protein